MNLVFGCFFSVLVVIDRMGVIFEFVVKLMWWMVCCFLIVKCLLGGMILSLVLVLMVCVV